MDNERLYDLTVKLHQYNQAANESLMTCKETGEKADFYSVVKPFADKVKELCNEWEPLAITWVMRNRPKYLHPLQIRNTAENLQMVSVRAFFPDTSLKRFNSHIQSIDYILQGMLDVLQEETRTESE